MMGPQKGFDIGFQLLKNSFISIHQVNFKDSETNFRNCQQTSYNKFNNLKVESYQISGYFTKNIVRINIYFVMTGNISM